MCLNARVAGIVSGVYNMKLNLGCGNDLRDDYINVDLDNMGADYNCDLSELPLPWKDDSVDVIELHHVLEHLFVHPLFFIKDLHRILKPNGVLNISLPLGGTIMVEHLRHKHGVFYLNHFLVNPIGVVPIKNNSYGYKSDCLFYCNWYKVNRNIMIYLKHRRMGGVQDHVNGFEGCIYDCLRFIPHYVKSLLLGGEVTWQLIKLK